MSHELMYTSVPKGLRLGSMGYCTVAVTQNCPSLLQEKLENLSGYRHLFSPFDANARLNPVCHQHLRMSIGGKTYSILSCIADAGIDYSKRVNKFAHHVAIESSECPIANAAWALSQPGFLQSRWEGEPHTISVGRLPAAGGSSPKVAHAWKQMTGDAGWAGTLADAYLKDPGTPYYLIFDPGTSVLPLFVEAIALLPRDKQWQVTFSTYYQAMSTEVQCTWRAVARNSVEAQQALARKLPMLDLAKAGGAPDSNLAHLARTGERLKEENKPASKPASSPEKLVVPLASYAFADEAEIDEPIPLKPAKKTFSRDISLKTFDEKQVETQKETDDEPPKSKVPFFIAAAVIVLLLLFGILVAIVISLPGGKTEQAKATQPVPVNNEAAKNAQEKGEQQKGGPENKRGQNQAQVEEQKGKGKIAPDGSLDALEKKAEERKNEQQKEPEKKNDSAKPPENGLVPAPKNEAQQFGTVPGTVEAPALKTADPVKLPSLKPGFKTLDGGNAPLPNNPGKQVDPIQQPEFIPVVYHKVPEVRASMDNQLIPLAVVDSNIASVSFLHDDVIKGQVFKHTRKGNTYFFETVENPRREITGAIEVGELKISPGTLSLSVPKSSNVVNILNLIKANPILAVNANNRSVLHVFVDVEPASVTDGTGPVNVKVDRSLWPEITQATVEADKSGHQKLERINNNWFKQININWAKELTGSQQLSVVLGHPDTVKYFISKNKQEQPCLETDLRRKVTSLRLEVRPLNLYSLETTGTFKVSYVGKRPPEVSKDDNAETDRQKQKETEKLIKEANELSPVRFELHEFKYILTVNGKSFMMWQNKPTPAVTRLAPPDLNAGATSK